MLRRVEFPMFVCASIHATLNLDKHLDKHTGFSWCSKEVNMEDG